MRKAYLFLFGIIAFSLVGVSCSKPTDAVPSNMPQLFVPTAFTPNGDGINDLFLVKCTPSLTYYHIKIFDNSNIQVYDCADMNTGWNGNVNGQPEPSGSYLWSIEYQSIGTSRFTQSGYVQLIR